MSGHSENLIFCNKRKKIGRPEHLLIPHLSTSNNILFSSYHPPSPSIPVKVDVMHSRQILFPRTSHWCPPPASQTRPDLTSLGCPNLTSWRHPRDLPNLTFKGRPWEIEWGRLKDVLRTSRRKPSKYSNSDVPIFFKSFFWNLFDWQNPVKLLRWNIFCKTS